MICALALGCGVTVARAEDVVPVEGSWHATTSAGLPVGFEVSGGRVVNPRFRFDWGFCGSFETAARDSVSIEPDGHWKYVDPRGPSIEGAFVASDRVEGAVTAPSRLTPGCPETHAGFVATPGEATFERAEAVVEDNVRTQRLSQRPRRMLLARDGSFKLYALRWWDFGKSTARAGGRAYLRRGCRRCPGREARRPRVSVLLDNLTQQGDYRVYLRIRYVLHGPVPRGFAHRGGRFLG